MRRLTLHAVIFVTTLGLVLFGLGRALEAFAPWRAAQDPRARLLWDGDYDGSRIVLLGDSEFCSYYVDRPEQTIWARVAALTSESVFPGALNGAKPDDLLIAGRHVAETWPSGTTVYIDLPPTRFVVTRVAEPAAGNYPDAFLTQYGRRRTDGGPIERVETLFYRTILKPFFLVRQREFLGNIIDRPSYFGRGARRDRAWSDDATFARERFSLLERNVVTEVAPRPFDWIEELTVDLASHGLQPVLVLTPVNVDLIDAYAADAQKLRSYLEDVRRATRRYAADRGIAVLDTDGAVPSRCFADLVHTNACGDDLLARQIADDFLTRRAPKPAR